jgi:predicted DNA-binding antitoxin AbrB/MazE fold protein
MKEGISESVIDDMKDIVASKSIKDVKFSDGKKRKVDMTTASKIVSMHKQLNKENQAKVERMLNDSNKFMQIVQFAMNIGK